MKNISIIAKEIVNTNSKMKRIDFPSLRQTYEYSCGTSVLQSILLFYGIDKREGEIIKNVEVSKEKGTKYEDIIKFLKSFNFNVEEKQNCTIDDLKKFIDNNLPVIIILQAWVKHKIPNWEKSFDNGHYAIAIGYTENHIIFSDPAAISETYLSYQDLDKRWHDKASEKIYDHYAIIPFGKEQKFKSNYFIRMG